MSEWVSLQSELVTVILAREGERERGGGERHLDSYPTRNDNFSLDEPGPDALQSAWVFGM